MACPVRVIAMTAVRTPNARSALHRSGWLMAEKRDQRGASNLLTERRASGLVYVT